MKGIGNLENNNNNVTMVDISANVSRAFGRNAGLVGTLRGERKRREGEKN